jgi:hypothetical protein
MHLIFFIKLFLLGPILFMAALKVNAQMVPRAEERAEQITLAASFFDRQDPVLQQAIREMPSPFVRQSAVEAARRAEEAARSRRSRPVAAEPSSNNNLSKTAAIPDRLDESETLQIITRSFRPSGSLRMGSQSFLLVPGGSGPPTRLAVGSSFEASVEGERYRVTIESVDERGYTLRLGSATATRQFLQNRLEGISPAGP